MQRSEAFDANEFSFRITHATEKELPLFRKMYPGHKVEYYDTNYIYCLARPTTRHNKAAFNIAQLLSRGLENSERCTALADGEAYFEEKVIPDASILCYDKEAYVGEGKLQVAIEVLSPSNCVGNTVSYRFDSEFQDKLKFYMRKGVAEIYMINTENQTMRRYESHLAYQEFSREDTATVYGMEIRVADIFKFNMGLPSE